VQVCSLGTLSLANIKQLQKNLYIIKANIYHFQADLFWCDGTLKQELLDEDILGSSSTRYIYIFDIFKISNALSRKGQAP
jgi:hypothetical protein